MPATYEPISTVTLGSAASTITFSAIPNTFTDLKLILTGNSRYATSFLRIRYNGNSSAIYSTTWLSGSGTAATSSRNTSTPYINSVSTFYTAGNSPSMAEIDIFSYAGSTNKTCLFRVSGDQNGIGFVNPAVGLWSNTSAITSVTVELNGDEWSSGTTATLYGILRA